MSKQLVTVSLYPFMPNDPLKDVVVRLLHTYEVDRIDMRLKVIDSDDISVSADVADVLGAKTFMVQNPLNHFHVLAPGRHADTETILNELKEALG